MMMTVDLKQLKKLRRELHSRPEISGMEKMTAERIIEFLKTCHPDDLETGIGGYGIVATWDSGKNGEEIIFRAELDALPIQETNDFDHKSIYEGKSHKCGHDGHSTILCGLAQFLSSHKLRNGKVRLLFQPAEENGEGAKAMLNHELLSSFHPDFVFAMHNLPGYPLHEVVVKENTFTAAVNSIIIHLNGKTSHAAEPEHGINPALAVSELLKESILMECNIAEREDMRVITPVYVELGEKAYGISAGRASVHLTLRCWNDENLHKLEKDIEQLALRIAKKSKLSAGFEYTQTFHANVNNAAALEKVRNAATSKGYTLNERSYPFKWGEDFGLFTSRFNGCMFGIGAGENLPALHNPDYDFPDELIDTGVQIFSGIIDHLLIEK